MNISRFHHSKEVRHAVDMARVLGMRANNVEWMDKTQAAVYRGSCYPTANPDGDTPGYLLLRGALCQEAARLNSPFIDVGTHLHVMHVMLLIEPSAEYPVFLVQNNHHRHRYRPLLCARRWVGLLFGRVLQAAV